MNATINRRIIALKLFCAILAGAVIFLSPLPSLGRIWHSVLLERQHLYVGTLREDLRCLPLLSQTIAPSVLPVESFCMCPNWVRFKRRLWP